MLAAALSPLATRELLARLGPGDLLAADRNFLSHGLLAEVLAAGVHVLWRAKSDVDLPVLDVLPDGTWLSRIANPAASRKMRRKGQDPKAIPGITVRVIEYTVESEDGSETAGVWGIGRRATEASADGPNGLAFERAGNLYVAGSNAKTLLMITSSGIMQLPDGKDGFYPQGPGGLVLAPNGSVLAMNTQQIDRITSHGVQVLYRLPAHPRIGIEGFPPDGIAVAANGTIYLDTDRGNGFASKTALIAIGPSGKARVIWKS